MRLVVPNLVTSANIAAGFLSIAAAAEGRFEVAVYLLIAAVLLDTLDGPVARKLDATSKFGQEMDSFSDALSFGAAPALLVYWAVLEPMGWMGLASGLLFLLAAVFRLARFNLTSDAHEKSGRTLGFPTPIGAGYLMAVTLMRDQLSPTAAALIVLGMAALMVSRVRLPQIKGRGVASYAIMIGIVNYFVVAIWPNWYTIGWWNIWNVVTFWVARVETRKLARLESSV